MSAGGRGFRIYEELDFARFGDLATFAWICYTPTRRHADTFLPLTGSCSAAG